MRENGRGFVARHPRAVLATTVVVLMMMVVGMLELGLRLFGSLNIHYYTGHRTPGMHVMPYGNVPINKDGYPDQEFVYDPARRRIAYLGDSIAYGVGAGYGYRIPDLLRRAYPAADHWVFAAVGDGFQDESLLESVDRYHLDSVVYLMNLNDILPDLGKAKIAARATQETWLRTVQVRITDHVDAVLRGRSYVYTYARLGLKNFLQRMGYEAHGLPAYELAPRANRAIIDATVTRIRAAFQAAQTHHHVPTCVVILPYEMQVSQDAARRYRELGFEWEEGFEKGSTQAILRDALARAGVEAFDAMEAFAGQNLKVGEAYVYDKGDKIDWNHPNRKGHALIARWLASSPRFVSKCLDPAER